MSNMDTASQMKQLLRRIRAARSSVILHYDHSKNDLVVWRW